MNEAGKRRAAKLWHRIEFGLVFALLVTSVVGVLWAEYNGQPRFVETHPR